MGQGLLLFQTKWVGGTLCRIEVLHGHLLGIKFRVHFFQILIVFEVPLKGCLEVAKIPNIDDNHLQVHTVLESARG